MKAQSISRDDIQVGSFVIGFIRGERVSGRVSAVRYQGDEVVYEVFNKARNQMRIIGFDQINTVR